MAILAVIFDFDDTLLPDSTTRLLESHGADPGKFWGEARLLVESGFDQTLAYLKLLLDNIGEGRPIGALTNAGLREFGTKLDAEWYEGLPFLFNDLREIVKSYKDIGIEFYIISGGLKAIIEGSQNVKKYFYAAYACELAEDGSGRLRYIKRCVSFTEKTRYLFEINKGLEQADTYRNPFLVNKEVAPAARRIPFKNMIYVGDGLTDIPCFSLLKKEGGTPFGVFNPLEEKSAKRAFLEFLKSGRVVSVHAPRYRKEDELGSLLRAAVATQCSRIQLERAAAE